MRKKIYTLPTEILNHVCSQYKKNDTELNSLFFAFLVKAPAKVLLETYKDIQRTINGDYVARLENPVIYESDGVTYIKGKETDLISEDQDYMYEGSYSDFLNSFNNREEETGLCRIMEQFTEDENLCGIKLEFIF